MYGAEWKLSIYMIGWAHEIENDFMIYFTCWTLFFSFQRNTISCTKQFCSIFRSCASIIFFGRRWREFCRYVNFGSPNIYIKIWNHFAMNLYSIDDKVCSVYSVRGGSNAGDIDYAKNSIEAPYFIDSDERIWKIIENSIQFHSHTHSHVHIIWFLYLYHIYAALSLFFCLSPLKGMAKRSLILQFYSKGRKVCAQINSIITVFLCVCYLLFIHIGDYAFCF